MGKSATINPIRLCQWSVLGVAAQTWHLKKFLLEMNLSRKKMASPSALGSSPSKPRSPSRVLPGRGVLWSSAKILVCASRRLSHIWAGDPGHTSAHKLYLE
ncbi:uncharacterized protein CIMG_05081 [Coccidioides immitis RS]|uniref:Uncharacterized protein n=3 Tax=Coccidioides immitis TaxID=5501 RepID=A0A0E1RZ60_COCIM|nr:uncharacterized protein CIMG_05081 [Coccidioides immitis RS]EAS34057.1 hypothetical protein CIMG_05081 [Coccidioides immitis RS]KMP05275.1 hypothetical protein CIRG_04956 [Coccidioides immitis RMSCC 2394]KMU77807.1 hypothetical protein CISG_01563 [Coccidioides immitis RMSCC 3703]